MSTWDWGFWVGLVKFCPQSILSCNSGHKGKIDNNKGNQNY